MSHTFNLEKLLAQLKAPWDIRTKSVDKIGKFNVNEVTSTNCNGDRSKVVFERENHGKVEADVIIIAPRIKIDDKPYFVLTLQWREPSKSFSVAFPAGTVKKGETAIEAGLRELGEETPFTMTAATASYKNTRAYSSDGCLGETYVLWIVDVQLKDGATLKDGIADGPINQQKGEDIKTFYIPEDTLYRILEKMVERGCAVDGRLMSFALGLTMRVV